MRTAAPFLPNHEPACASACGETLLQFAYRLIVRRVPLVPGVEVARQIMIAVFSQLARLQTACARKNDLCFLTMMQ